VIDLEVVRSWIDADPDLETKKELQDLVDKGEIKKIESLFESRLSFGTAGLRAELGPGPMRMNRLVVAQTAQGIADFLNANKSEYLDPHGQLSAVIGFDARKNSDIFAKDSAEILAGNGIHVELFEHHVPTPVVAFTGKQKNSSVSIVVTASHNPPNDNGYKVYLGGQNGNSQIVPPQDSEIASKINKVRELNPSSRSSEYKLIGGAEIDAYVSRALEISSQVKPSNLKIVYTAMHGVGWEIIKEILLAAGFSNIHPVAEQIEPDPTFPTVEFPNPEEPGAMDLALAKARDISADLIIANDPDADRLAIGVPTSNGFRMLSGNELGILIADFVSRKKKSGTMAASYVSSQQILKLAKARGLSSELTPTGFKWISKVENLIFGYEEALGYCVDPDYTPDKDGLTAALLACEIAQELSGKGMGFEQALEQIALQTGHFQSSQISLRLDSMAEVTTLMNKLQTQKEAYFDGLALEIRKLVEIDPRLDMLEITPDKNSRALIRASGTEPKLKCYLEASGESFDLAGERLQKLESVMREFLQQ